MCSALNSEIDKAATVEITSDLDFCRINKADFILCPADSVDYAVMEKTADALVFPMDAGWSDIGSWSSLWDISEKDINGNVSLGDVITHRTKNSFVRTDGQLVTTIGVNDLVIIATKDAVMVAHKDSVQDTKVIVEQLKHENRNEWELNREVYRPWGKYDSIDSDDGYQVKRLTVNPGAKLSFTMECMRASQLMTLYNWSRFLLKLVMISFMCLLVVKSMV